MPVVDNLVIPELEWCSARAAVLWIIFRTPPVDITIQLMEILDLPGIFGFYDGDKPVSQHPEYGKSWNKLFLLARMGKITLKGKPSLGIVKVNHTENPFLKKHVNEINNGFVVNIDDVGGKITSEKWGDYEIIGKEIIKDVSFPLFKELVERDCLTDGSIVGFSMEYSNRGYSDVSFNFRELSEIYHPPEGQSITIGGDIKFIDSTAQPHASMGTDRSVTDENKDTPQPKNLGGRPPKWDWEEALCETLVTIFYADGLNEEDPKLWREYMLDWFAKTNANGETPSVTEVRKRINLMKATFEKKKKDLENKNE